MIYDLIILGNGIAALCVLYELKKSGKNISVVKIFDEVLAPSCSLKSTATITLRGMGKGTTPLGEEIYYSYQAAEQFIKSENPTGVVPAKFYSVDSKVESGKSSWGLGFDGYIFHPEKFLNFLTLNTNHLHDSCCGTVVSTVLDSELIVVTLLNGESIKAKKIILCSGAYTKLYEKLYPEHPAINNAKIVPGAYLEKINWNLGQDSFVLSKNGENFIYDSIHKIVKIGATTQGNAVLMPDIISLKRIYGDFRELLGEELPAFSDFEIKVGIRQKGKRRMPFYGKITENVFALISLYKNGYIFPFKGAREIINLL